MALGVDLQIRITGNGGTTIILTPAEAMTLRDWLIQRFPPIADKRKPKVRR